VTTFESCIANATDCAMDTTCYTAFVGD
jgi:hypothetical protein